MATRPRPGPSRAQWLRRLATRRRDKVAWVFSGGGPLGALQVGATRALFDHGVPIDLAVGTSVGGLNASILAFEPDFKGARRMEQIWRGVEEGELFPGGRFRAPWARMLVRGDRVFDNSGLRRMIQRAVGDARFEDAQLPLGIVTTELDTGSERLFTSGPLELPLLASCGMPGVYPPVEIDGVRYIDGGVANNVPIAPAISMGAKTIYVLNASSHSHQRRPLNRPMDYLLHAFSLARSQRLTFEETFYATSNVRLVMLPTVELDFFVPFASVEHTPKLIDLAYEITARFLRGETAVDHVTAHVDDVALEAIRPAK